MSRLTNSDGVRDISYITANVLNKTLSLLNERAWK